MLISPFFFKIEPILVAVRLAENGCLLNVLKKNRENAYINIEGKKVSLTDTDRIRIARDVANGMLHLSSKVVSVLYVFGKCFKNEYFLPACKYLFSCYESRFVLAIIFPAFLLCSVFTETLPREMFSLARITLLWCPTLAYHVTCMRVVNTKTQPGYESDKFAQQFIEFIAFVAVINGFNLASYDSVGDVARPLDGA